MLFFSIIALHLFVIYATTLLFTVFTLLAAINLSNKSNNKFFFIILMLLIVIVEKKELAAV